MCLVFSVFCIRLVCFIGNATTRSHSVQAGVPQRGVSSSLLVLLYTADIPVHSNLAAVTFADDTAIISKHSQCSVAIHQLQKGTENVSKWAKKWRFHINEGKSVRLDFTLLPHPYAPHAPTVLDGKTIPLANAARYLGLHMDCKLN